MDTAQLIGSEKQIKWATDIRAQYITETERVIGIAARLGQAERITAIETAREKALAIGDCSFWIDMVRKQDVNGITTFLNNPNLFGVSRWGKG